MQKDTSQTDETGLILLTKSAYLNGLAFDFVERMEASVSSGEQDIDQLATVSN